jgi:hypothetical protein
MFGQGLPAGDEKEKGRAQLCELDGSVLNIHGQGGWI